MPGSMPRNDYPPTEAQPVRPTGIPASFGGPSPQPAVQSPFDEDDFGTPNQRPTGLFRHGDAPYEPHQDGRFNAYDRSLEYASVHPFPSS